MITGDRGEGRGGQVVAVMAEQLSQGGEVGEQGRMGGKMDITVLSIRKVRSSQIRPGSKRQNAL